MRRMLPSGSERSPRRAASWSASCASLPTRRRRTDSTSCCATRARRTSRGAWTRRSHPPRRQWRLHASSATAARSAAQPAGSPRRAGRSTCCPRPARRPTRRSPCSTAPATWPSSHARTPLGCAWRRSPSTRARRSRRALARSRSQPSADSEELRVDVLVSLGVAHGHRGEEQARALLDEALAAGLAAGLHVQCIRACVSAGGAALDVRDHAWIEGLAAPASALVSDYQSQPARDALAIDMAWSLLDRGRYDEALAVADTARESRLGFRPLRLALEGVVAVRRGAPGGEALLAQAEAALRDVAHGRRHLVVRTALAEAAWIRGDHAAALAHARAGARGSVRRPVLPPGRRSRAVGDALRRARCAPGPRRRARPARARGRLARRDPRMGCAARALRGGARRAGRRRARRTGGRRGPARARRIRQPPGPSPASARAPGLRRRADRVARRWRTRPGSRGASRRSSSASPAGRPTRPSPGRSTSRSAPSRTTSRPCSASWTHRRERPRSTRRGGGACCAQDGTPDAPI